MKKLPILLLTLLALAACRNEKQFTIRGIISNTSQKVVYLNKLDVTTSILIDSAKIRKNGKFSFRIKESKPEFYMLGFSDSDFITILAKGGDKINLEFRGENLYSNYSVSGSDDSEKLRILDIRLASAKTKLDSLRNLYGNALRENAPDEKLSELDAEYTEVIKELRIKTIGFIIENIHSLSTIKALYQKIDENTYVLFDPRDIQYLKIVSDTLSKYYPDSRQVQSLVQDTRNELDRFYSRQLESIAENTPGIVLDPTLEDIYGQRVSLSSLKGKIVLLSFWSARSKECIADNLHLKEVYKTFKEKGFEIYQINIDQNEEDWKTAVRFDELPWISTRETDPANPRYAKLYNVRTVPANYLYDRNGIIVAKNIFGRSLNLKLNQLLNN
ncbi:MAG: thioredoxin-like domain-containing protein [Bacteroidales bacterium]|jgi:hypothetical protein